MNELEIPSWTEQDYCDSQAPFEWLYQFKDNKFILAQMREKVKRQAEQVGIKNFISLWNSYFEMVTSSKGGSLDEVMRFDGQEIELLNGEYTCDEIGITTINQMGHEILVCNHPIMPVSRMVNIDTGEVKIEIAYKRGRTWRKMIVDKSTLASSQKIVELSKYGISVDSENAKYLVKFFTNIEHLNYDRIEETNSVSRLGWIEGYGFSPYVDKLKFDGDLNYRDMFKAVRAAGDYQEWLDCVKQVRQDGIIARILLASSFSSVLVEPLNIQPYFVHIWGGTETGKTVGLMLAASVWANPSMGEYIKTFNSTAVGQELTAAFVNSMPLCLDELQVIKERKDFDQIIYMLSEGIGKSRGAKTGGMQKVNTWKNCVITTGEQPLSSTNSGGGAVNRIVEIDCQDEQIFGNNAPTVVDVIKKNYGFAGKIFIDKLKNKSNLEYASMVQKQFYKSLLDGISTDKQAMVGSVILTADKLANEWIFNDNRCLLVDDIKQFLTSKEEVSQNNRTYAWIMDFIASNPNRFKTNSFGEYPGEVWGTIDEKFIYINKSVFDDKLQKQGYSPTAFLSWAKQNRVIECEKGRTTKSKRICGNITRCVVLHKNIVGLSELVMKDEYTELPFEP